MVAGSTRGARSVPGYVLDRFGRNARRAAERFDAFVAEGRTQSRRPELSGALDAGEAAQVRRMLGDGHRVSDGVLGSEAFVAKVRRDAERVEAALSSRGLERRSGAVRRPSEREVLDAVLEHRGEGPDRAARAAEVATVSGREAARGLAVGARVRGPADRCGTRARARHERREPALR